MRVKVVHVEGRFHSSANSAAAEKLNRLCGAVKEMQFPTVDKVRVPLRSTVNGEIITKGPLHCLAIEMTLLKKANWYGTMKATVQNIPTKDSVIVFSGFGDHIPASLLQDSGLQVVSLGSTEGHHTQRLVEASWDDKVVNGLTLNGNSFNDIPVDINGQYPQHSVAVVGMSCRLPGADSVDDFWQLLLSGTSMVEPAPAERLKLHTLRGGERVDTKWWGNFLRDPDAFDHRFFKKSSREAGQYDPQQRVLLEVTYEAIESSGYFGNTSKLTPNDYGCYIGVVANNYYDNVSCHPPTVYSMLGTSRAFFSGRLSHYFGWTGPALTVDTACSSSLVAINAACKAIQAGECSRAVAGGTNIFTSPFDYQNLAAAGFLSPTGACKPFDAAADGYCRGEGVAVVVLKSLASAIEENDSILGVITGSAVNQNENPNPITVPHSESQSAVYHNVASMADIDPYSVSYVEAHGTGTPVGDPIECQSIRQVFGSPSREETLYFGSVKGNIGHTEATAGIAGLIKVLLMMRHGTIPAQAGFSNLNPNIPSLEADRMAIPASTRKWSSSSRLACINSYGAAGSNAAIMVRPKPENIFNSVKPIQEAHIIVPKYPVFLSAASANSLSMYCRKLLTYVRDLKARHASERLVSDLTFNLADMGNHSLPHVTVTTVTDNTDLVNKLEAAASGSITFQSEIPKQLIPVVLVFGGQESEMIGISEQFYQSCSLFRHHLDYCNGVLIDNGVVSLYPAVFQRTSISNVVTLHSALFSVQYSCAKAWMDCGCDVSAVIGHSFGQLTALCISGCLTVNDALKLVVERARIMLKHWGPERGSMVSLQTNGNNFSKVLDLLKAQGNGDDVEVACFNYPESHVLVGSDRAVEALEEFVVSDSSLRDSARIKKLRVTHGFHSRLTDPLLPHLTKLAEQLDWKEPTIHMETCTESQNCERPDANYIKEHTRLPVFFHQAVERLTQRFSACTWLEAGHGSSVMQLLRGAIGARQDKVHSILSSQLTTPNAAGSLSEVTVSLWRAGYKTQYWLFHRSQKQRYQSLILPPYQFEKSRHWLPYTERTETVAPAESVLGSHQMHELLSFVAYKDDSKSEAKFVIDPQNERYRSLLEGHITAGQALAPSSLYFELVTRAALSLHARSASLTHVPCVEPLSMKTPIGLNANRELFLILCRIHEAQENWSFNMYSRSKSEKYNNDPIQHAVGIVYILKRDNAQLVQSFRRFESLIGFRRCEQILNDPEAEKMQGQHIYRAIRGIVHFNEQFKGIRSIAAVHHEAAGIVVKSAIASATPDEKLCDTPMLDSMMQFAGLLVNYFTHPSDEELLVCSQIERFQIGGSFNPEAGKWLVYANLTEDSDKETLCDVYVFEAESRKLVVVILGFSFFKSSRASLARILKDVNLALEDPSSDVDKETKTTFQPMPMMSKRDDPLIESRKAKPRESSSVRANLVELLSKVTDVPVEEITDEGTLEDLGIDSLVAMEVLNEIRKVFGVNIDMTAFLFFENIRDFTIHLDESLGHSKDADTTANAESGKTTSTSLADMNSQENPKATPGGPVLRDPQGAFEEIQYEYDRIAVETKAAGFWAQVYPTQRRLVLAYVVDGYAALGCNMASLKAGVKVPEIEHLPRHKRLKGQLDRILEDGKLISLTADGWFRTDIPVDPTPAEDIYQQVLAAYPQHASVHKLVKVSGSELAACLTGKKDALQLVFANKDNKANLDDVYENWPLVRSGTLVLGEFLKKVLPKVDPSAANKFRILEIGAGTGGTTKYIVHLLRSLNISFQYTFTDISSSLVTAARRQFKGVESMEFKVMDVEKPPKDEDTGTYHIVISTNCIHATRILKLSLTNIHKMLRDDGVVALVEITKNMFWLDIAVGFFEGWWLFEDGRSHAVTSETLWKQGMKEAGFQEVKWSSGKSPESNTIRLLAGFKEGC